MFLKFLLTSSLILLINFSVFAQTRVIYGGINYSNVRLDERAQDNKFYPGVQFGFYRGNKSTNFRKRVKLINRGFAFEYNQIQFFELNLNSDNLEKATYHSTRLSIPFKIRLTPPNATKLKLQFNLEPGLSYFAVKTISNTIIPQHGFAGLDLYTNAGLNLTIGGRKKEFKKSGYKFTGLVLSANRYIKTNPFDRWFNTPISLDQFQLNAGLEFSYIKVKKKKARFRFFRKS